MDISAQYWNDLSESDISQTAGDRRIYPDQYRSLTFDTESLLDILSEVPREMDTKLSESDALLNIPMPDGSTVLFRIVEYEMMEKPLADKYPKFRTYRGIGVKEPTIRIHFDWTERGFRAMIVTPTGSAFIDPLYRNNNRLYQSYYKRDIRPSGEFKCFVEDVKTEINENDETFNRQSGDCLFRSYRLAVATTGEYSNYFGVTSDAGEGTILSEVMTAINRVNEVYEADVAIRLILIASTVDIFYYDGSNDPYSNGNGSAMLNQNQTTCDNIIGSANYDIGHVFSTGGGGVAQLYSPCSGGKARGVTGQSMPENDPFSIDYVAHEMGHQFGGNHTQNNSCNRAATASMEPGSASTIMGYAGICSPNVQSNSDAYFHGRSIEEINAFISGNGDGNDCDTPLAFDNMAPVIVTAGNDYTIPISTPFVLTADASDPDGDPLTYCWEQWDPEVGAIMPPASTNIQGPMFRSFFATPSPSRYFPRLSDLVNNTPFDWEELPSVTRNMDFRVTVRDYHNVAGCTTEDNVLVSTIATAGPFVVLTPGAGVTWTETETVNITWDIANTNLPPVNCSNVDIFLSYDGGFTYPAQLASNTPNDGNQMVDVPLGTTNTGRIMVKAADNIFFDISNDNITINIGAPNFALSTADQDREICDENSVSYTIDVISNLNFTDPVTLSLTDQPIGSTVLFSSNPVIPGNQTILTIGNLTNAAAGNYLMVLTGSSTTGDKSLDLVLDKTEVPEIVEMTSPDDSTEGVYPLPMFEWIANPLAIEYTFQLSTDAGFNSILETIYTAQNSYQLENLLNDFTTYYWRVRGTNECGDGLWPTARSFVTGECATPALIDLTSPVDAEEGVSSLPLLVWSADTLVEEYTLQLSTDAAFNSVLQTINISQNSFQLNNSLEASTTYFWRVRGTNICGEGAWPTAFSFTTRECAFFNSVDTPIDIPSSGTPTITSTINISSGGQISDINVSLDITHSWVADLDITLIAPNGDRILLINDQCGSNDDMLLIFDDEASSSSIPCPPTNGLAYQPVENLSVLYGMSANGIWTLEVADDANQDGGILNNWSLEICTESFCELMVNSMTGSENGSLFAAIECATSGDTIRFDANLNGDIINLDAPIIIDKNLVIINTHQNFITINAANNMHAFQIENGGMVIMQNLSLVGHGSSEGSAIINNGTLKLIDTHVTDSGGSANQTSILNLNNLTLEGDCEVND